MQLSAQAQQLTSHFVFFAKVKKKKATTTSFALDAGLSVQCRSLAFTSSTLVIEHLLSIASCPSPLILIELAPAMATKQDSDANET